MSCDLDTKFVKVDHVGENLLINQMESTLKTYLDWGLLSVGGWTNIEITTPGAFGGSFDTLRAVDRIRKAPRDNNFRTHIFRGRKRFQSIL